MLWPSAILCTFISATLLVKSTLVSCLDEASPQRLLVVTVPGNPSGESFQRFNQSIAAYDLGLTIVGLDSELEAANKETPFARAKRKFEVIKKTIANYKNEPDLLIMLVDSTNLIVNGDQKTILNKFAALQTKLLFSADTRCWPNSELAGKYPPLADKSDNLTAAIGQPYLDSRALIGYAPSLWEFLSLLPDVEDQLHESFARMNGNGAAQQQKHQESAADNKAPATFRPNQLEGDLFLQLYSSHVYLNEQTRRRIGISLDHWSELFENLHTTKNDVELEFDLDSVNVRNLAYKTNPVVIHGSGPSKSVLNSLGNYLGRAWTQNDGCRQCNRTMFSLNDLKESDWPVVLVGVFIEEPTPFLDYFFEHLLALSYPKHRLHLFVHNQVEYHAGRVAEFFRRPEVGEYASRRLVDWQGNDEQQRAGAKLAEWEARVAALGRCEQVDCDYYFALDSLVHLELNDTLRLLIETNRTIVAPLVSRPRKLWSNFWGAITPEGYYSRSHDYVELVSRERLGVWNVPHIMNAYLIEGKFLKATLARDRELASAEPRAQEVGPNEIQLTAAPGRAPLQSRLAYFDPKFPSVKPVLIFSRNLRSANVFQFVTNAHDFGHLVDPTSFNLSRTNPEFYQLEDNMLDWERRYLHENYSRLLDDQATPHLESPCPDVYWFPVVSESFTRQLIEIMEAFGTWSSGTSDDPRIEGGYESVPTRDIHFKQVGLHDMWLTFLREYIMPIQLKEYIGYEHDPPRTDLAFVVRYHPAEQASLRPHHDSSTYTLNIALNEPGADYQGGGCRFVRYNCSVTESRRGWALIHPGRLTHYHEGLPVTAGTRYILVTFVDP